MIYLYLTSRDKKKVNIITLFEGTCPLTHLSDIKGLQLPWQWESEINYIINNYPNTEIWMTSADSYEQFQVALRNQGCANTPPSNEPHIWLSHIETDVAERSDLIRKGRKPVTLEAGVITRLHHRHKMSKYQTNKPLS
jgi:hypothetical protein